VAKSLAAGMPLSAVVGRKDLMDRVHPSGVGGTYGANPLACRAALAVLAIFETEDLLAQSRALGEKLRQRFDQFQAEYEVIGDVRGIGPMLALELVENRTTKTPAGDAAKKLVGYCHERGLIILACGGYGNVIRVLMPLVITDEQLEKGLSIMADGLATLKP
jgi:4-aminobutyrate aminotransferase/(S)-3-amino-2-methylpropionate transaminase